jgi:pyruvate kinase
MTIRTGIEFAVLKSEWNTLEELRTVSIASRSLDDRMLGCSFKLKCRGNMAGTKIVCTVGPSSNSPDILRRLIDSGMDVVRLNFSHGSHAFHRRVFNDIRNLSSSLNKPIAVLQDLAGSKIRIGPIQGDHITLETGSTFTLTGRKIQGNAKRVSTSRPDLVHEVQPGDPVLLADGALELEVLHTTDRDIVCRVLIGGTLTSHKGINLPTRSLKVPHLTEKDCRDLTFGLKMGVDYVAMSFVRSAQDIQEIRRLMAEQGVTVPVIAKIEKHEALDNIDPIVESADGIMVARGDLGVETPLEKVPLVQKTLIQKANRAGIPVITATQMLRSMVESPRPTRAEVTDVANAVLDGTDAVMLSEETAVGKYPVKAVSFMKRIILDVEQNAETGLSPSWFDRDAVMPIPEAVSYAACHLARSCGAKAIITFTQTGSTARLVAKYRPKQLILAPTPSDETYRRLSLVRGVIPLKTEQITDANTMIRSVFRAAHASGWVKKGEKVVVTSGTLAGVKGSTNLIQAEILDDML